MFCDISRLVFQMLSGLILVNMLACSSFQNRHSKSGFHCGADIQPTTPWHKVYTPEGIELRGDELAIFPLSQPDSRAQMHLVSMRGCAILPADQTWLVTARSRKLYRIVRPGEVPATFPLYLQSTPEQSVQVSCPVKPINRAVKARDFLLFENVSVEESFPITYTLDGTNETPLLGSASLLTIDDQLRFDKLKDGSYQLKITVSDLLEGRSETAECKFTIDNQSPQIAVSSASSTWQNIEGHDVLSLPRDEVLRFSAAGPAVRDRIDYCFERIQEANVLLLNQDAGRCVEENLRTAFINDAVSPTENRGYWRLHYRAEDEAGNSSGWVKPVLILYTDQKTLDDLKQASRSDILQFLYNDGLGLVNLLRESLYQFKKWQSLVTDHEKELGRTAINSQLSAAYVSMNINGPMLVSPVPMNTVVISGDGKKVLAGHFNGDVRIWDSSSGELLGTLPGGGRSLGDLALSQDEKYLVTISYDLSVRIWDLVTHTEVRSFKCCETNANSVRVAISADQKHIVTTSWENEIKIWSFDGKLQRTISKASSLDFHSHSIMSVKITPDSRWVVSGSVDGTVRFWDIDTGDFVKKISAMRPAGINALAITKDGERVIFGGVDGRLTISRIVDGIIEHSIDASTLAIYSVDVSGTGILASHGEDRMVRLWDIQTGQAIDEPRKVEDAAFDEVAISHKGETVVASCNSNILRIWDRSIGNQLVKTFQPEGSLTPIRSLLVNPSNHHVIAGGTDGSLFEWNVADNQSSRKKAHADTIYDLLWDPTQPGLYSASKDGSLKNWSAELLTGQDETWSQPGQWIYSVAVSSDGRYMLIGTFSGDLILRDRHSGTEKKWTPHVNWVKVLYHEASGNFISASWDRTIRMWDPADGSLTRILARADNPVTVVTLSPDQRLLFAGLYNGKLSVWNLQEPDSVRTVDTNGQIVWDLVVSPDGSTLVSGTQDGKIRLFDSESLRMMGFPIPAHKRHIRALTIDGENQRLFSAAEDGLIKSWNLSFDQDVHTLHHRICQQIAAWVDSQWFNPDGIPQYYDLCRTAKL